MRTRDMALRVAGLVGIGTAAYHGIEGASIIDGIALAPEDADFVGSTFQLGTMGWTAAGVLLIGAAGFDSLHARTWVTRTAALLYGLPALGTLTLTGGRPSIGGIGLGVATALALYGRRLDVTHETMRFAPDAVPDTLRA